MATIPKEAIFKIKISKPAMYKGPVIPKKLSPVLNWSTSEYHGIKSEITAKKEEIKITFLFTGSFLNLFLKDSDIIKRLILQAAAYIKFDVIIKP